MRPIATFLNLTSPSAADQRQGPIEVVEDTAATLRMEGLEPTAKLQYAFKQYIAGKISVEQIARPSRGSFNLLHLRAP